MTKDLFDERPGVLTGAERAKRYRQKKAALKAGEDPRLWLFRHPSYRAQRAADVFRVLHVNTIAQPRSERTYQRRRRYALAVVELGPAGLQRALDQAFSGAGEALLWIEKCIAPYLLRDEHDRLRAALEPQLGSALAKHIDQLIAEAS